MLLPFLLSDSLFLHHRGFFRSYRRRGIDGTISSCGMSPGTGDVTSPGAACVWVLVGISSSGNTSPDLAIEASPSTGSGLGEAASPGLPGDTSPSPRGESIGSVRGDCPASALDVSPSGSEASGGTASSGGVRSSSGISVTMYVLLASPGVAPSALGSISDSSSDGPSRTPRSSLRKACRCCSSTRPTTR